MLYYFLDLMKQWDTAVFTRMVSEMHKYSMCSEINCSSAKRPSLLKLSTPTIQMERIRLNQNE